MTTTRWCKGKCECGVDGGSMYNPQKRIFAMRVAANLAGTGDQYATACHCGAAITLHDGEVDRTVAGCYRPGTVVMTCVRCNQERTHVAGFNVERFAAAVLLASAGVDIPKVTEARNAYHAGRPELGETVRRSRFYE